MATLSSLALPAVIDGTKIALTFTADATVGAQFTQLRHKEGGNFDHVTFLDNAILSETDGRLWEIIGKNTAGTEITVGPANAGSFSSYDATAHYGGAFAHLYEWRRVAVAGSTENDRLWVRLLAQLQNAGDSTCKFYLWVGRERGESFAITKVTWPVVWHKSHTEPRGAESHLVGSKRARLLIPQALITGSRLMGDNVATYVAAVSGLISELQGISVQPLQFFAEASANDLGASYRRIFYGQSMDTSGWTKSFKYRGLTVGTDAYVKFAPTCWPRFAKAFARGTIDAGLLPDSKHGNTFAAPYPNAVGALTAATDDWWYDVCDLYRTWYLANAAPPIVGTDANRSAFIKNPACWIGFIQVGGPQTYPESTMYAKWLERARAWLDYLNSAEVPSYPYSFLHCQNTHPYGDGNLYNPGVDVVETISSYFVAMTRAAHDRGIRVMAYSVPDFINNRNREPWGTVGGAGPCYSFTEGANGTFYPYDLQATRDFLIREIYDKLGNYSGCAAFYLDTTTGTGAPARYGPGGYYQHGDSGLSVGKRATIAAIRESAQRNSAFRTASVDAAATVVSEACEEGASELLEFTQDGYNWIPHHLALAERSIYDPVAFPGAPDLTLNDYPVATRNMAPPLWNAVHHQWAPSRRFSAQPVTVGLATNSAYHPSGPYTGMTAAEMVDVHCMSKGLTFIAGMAPIFLDLNTSFDYPLLAYNSAGEVVIPDAAIDPSSTGTTIFAYYKALYRATRLVQGGQFLLHGKMLRPPQVDLASASVTKAANPLAACRKCQTGATLGFPYGYAGSWATLGAALFDSFFDWNLGSLSTYSVPKILGSIWQAADGTIGLVLTNWSADAAATWLATINPAHYGAVNFLVKELDINGTPNLLGSPAGTFTIGNAGGPTVSIGAFAARAVRVFKLEPA